MNYYDKLVANSKYAYIIYNLVNFNDFYYNKFTTRMSETFEFTTHKDYENTVILAKEKETMNRIEDYAELTDNIVKWISDYCLLNKRKTLVVGISGGIDSSVVSTLSALTGMKTYVVGMPINQIEGQEELSDATW